MKRTASSSSKSAGLREKYGEINDIVRVNGLGGYQVAKIVAGESPSKNDEQDRIAQPFIPESHVVCEA